MGEYPKIQSIFKRESEKPNSMLYGQWTLPEFEYLASNSWTFTEKVDGTNIRVLWNGYEVDFKGKTDNAQIPPFLEAKLIDIFNNDIENKMYGEVFKNQLEEVILYGEGYGAKIQKGGGNYIKDGVDFVLFDVRVGNIWLERENVQDIADKLGLRIVPILGCSTLIQMIDMVEKGFNSQWGDFPAEGIVARPTVELKDRMDHRIITKLKHKDFKDMVRCIE